MSENLSNNQEPNPAAKQWDFTDNETDEKRKKEKEGEFKRGWAGITGWYKKHPEEIGEIMFEGAEHDAKWYQEHPEQINILVRDYLDQKEQQNEKSSEDGTFQPPALPELPDNHSNNEEFLPPAVLDANYDVTVADAANPPEGTELTDSQFNPPDVVSAITEQTQLDKHSPEFQKKLELAGTALREIGQSRREKLQALDDAYKNHEMSQTEYEAKRDEIDYYTLDRINRIAEDYSELRDDPIFQTAARDLKDFEDQARAKQNAEAEDRDILEAEDRDDLEAEDKEKGEADDKDEAEGEKELEADDKDEAEGEKEPETNEEIDAGIKKTEEDIKGLEERLAKLLNKSEKTGDQDKEIENTIKDLEKQLKTAHEGLKVAEKELAESYAKNRGLFAGKGNRAIFNEKKEKYSKRLNDYLRIEASLKYYEGQKDNRGKIQSEKDRLAEKIKSGEITGEEANQLLGDKWDEITKATKDGITEDFVDKYLKEQCSLENTTCDRIDNGNLYRKIVSKIINNKPLKTVLTVAGAAGLAATGIGLATGALAVGIGYTAGGIALGAGKGALSGAIMSRQDSKNSAVRGFTNQEEIREQLANINYEAIEGGEKGAVANVANWLMQQYDAANQADRSSNRKRTAIAMGLGAAIGGAMSGVHINQVTTEQRQGKTITQYEPTETKAANLENVNHAKGYGTQQLYRELGGDGDSYFSSGAHERMAEVIKKYGMTVGENDWTYPGPISEWPEVARNAFSEVANEWAKDGLVPAVKVGGQPVYDTVTYTVHNMISSKLHNFFTQAATVVGAGALGGAIAGMRNRANAVEMPNIQPAPGVEEPMPVRPFDETPPPDDTVIPVDEQGNQAPAGNPNQAPAEDYDTTTRNTFQDRIAEDGLRYMTSTEDLDNGLDRSSILNWFNGSPEDLRNEVANYMKANPGEPHGATLRNLIQEQENAPAPGYQDVLNDIPEV